MMNARYGLLLVTCCMFIEAKHIETASDKKTKTITNTITKKDIGYKYLFVTRYPQDFTIKVNDKVLKPGQSTTLDSDTFDVSYSYEWWAPWQIYKGSGTKKYRMPATMNDAKITFLDWHNKERITVPKAELLDKSNVIADQKKADKGKRRR